MLRKVFLYTLIFLISFTVGGFKYQHEQLNVYASSETGDQVALEETNDINNQTDAPDEMFIDGETFIKITNADNLQALVDLANKYDAVLYGLPNSDILLIIKDEQILLSSSTGSVSVKTNQANILIDYFSTKEIDGLTDDIETVIQTGEDISKINDDYTGYYIYTDAEWISVSF